MNYLEQYCQRANRTLLIGFSFLFLFSSCSSDPRPIAEKPKAIGVKAKPVWFSVPERFRFLTSTNEIVSHPFFDLTSFRTKERPELSFYVTTPSESGHLYDLDLVSGQLFREKSFCSQSDIWESSGSKINKPNFSQGIIPRLLDQTGDPQKIWVFGDQKFFLKNEEGTSVMSQRARVVGGVLLQFCDEYPCRSQTGWLSQLVLVAVNPYDPTLEKVFSIKELKEKVNWDYTKAFAENGFGRTVYGPKALPAYRMIGEIEAQVALDKAFKYGHSFEFEEINSLRKNCFYLYDYLWRSQKKVRANMRKHYNNKIKAKAKLDQRAKKLIELARFRLNRVISDNLQNDIKLDESTVESRRVLVDWARFFFFFHEKYGERFKTCSKFVRPANPKVDEERFWFFSYMKNWFHLEDLQYYYSCSRRSWVENTRLANGKLRYDVSAPRNCTSYELDESFEQAITVMSAFENSSKAHYRFLEFDNGIGGSHQELFSWTFSKGKKLGCDARKFEERSPIFPQDINWKKFSIKEKRGRYDIIR